MKKLAHFLLRDILSDGPAGTVYKAEEVLPGDNRRVVALKVMPGVPDGAVTGESDAERRFFGEVRVLAQLAVHPNVVTIYAMGVTDGYPWLAMEYSAGTLAQRMSEVPAEAGEVLLLLEQLAHGLAAMHALKPPLIHQDIKPGNILIDQVGNYKITDFSLATVTAANKTHGIATVRYAAPELLSGEFGRVGPATDLYALGHIAYEMALGQRLHRGQFPAVFEGNSSKEPPPNKWMMWHASMGMQPAAAAGVVKGFPGGLSEVIARLMTKQMGQRYGSAEELLSDLSVVRGEVLGGVVQAAAAMPASANGAAVAPARLAPALPTNTRAGGAAVSAGGGGGGSGRAEGSVQGVKPVGGSSAGSGAGVAVPGAGGAYWVRLRGKVTGPFDLGALQRQVKQGQLSRLHQVSLDQVTWKNATDVEGLYGPTVV